LKFNLIFLSKNEIPYHNLTFSKIKYNVSDNIELLFIDR